MNTIAINSNKAFFVFVVASILLLFFLYIFQVMSAAWQSGILQGYEARFSELDQENKKLSMGLTEMNSLSSLESFAFQAGFEKIGKVSHIQVLAPQVAAK